MKEIKDAKFNSSTIHNSLINKIKQKIISFKNKYQHHSIMNTFIVILICYIQYISLDFSCILAFEPLKVILLWGITTFSLFFITMIFVLITKKIKTTCIIMSVFVLILSIVNLLVYKYHGMPFVFSDLKNIETAFNVINSTNISVFIFQPRYLIFLVCFLIELFLCFFFEKSHTFKRRNSLAVIIICGIGIYYSYFSSDPLVPINALSAIPYDSIKQYSYFPSLVRQLLLSLEDPLYMPDNYNRDDTIEFIANYNESTLFNKNYLMLNDSSKNNFFNQYASGEINTSNYPDIIIVLNESFFDLNEIVETKTNMDFLYNYHNLKDAITSYTIVPGTNGGTNVSEWELLTTNSYQLCHLITPFHELNMKNANSIVKYLKSLGYTTFACHPQSRHNYRRALSWQELGFDNVYFEEDFENLTYWGNRKATPTDDSTYENLIRWFEEMDSSSPKFAFCITMQNHPHYEGNKMSQNFIKSYANFGKNQNDVEEALSCIYLSDKSNKNLIDRYEEYDRDIIIAICGDHVAALDINYEYDDIYSHYTKLKSTPFILWSNNKNIINKFYDIPYTLEKPRLGLIYLMPSILESANMPISKYYNYLLNMRNILPIVTYGSYYYDANGNRHLYSDDDQFKNILDYYYNMEYLNITEPETFEKYYIN